MFIALGFMHIGIGCMYLGLDQPIVATIWFVCAIINFMTASFSDY